MLNVNIRASGQIKGATWQRFSLWFYTKGNMFKVSLQYSAFSGIRVMLGHSPAGRQMKERLARLQTCVSEWNVQISPSGRAAAWAVKTGRVLTSAVYTVPVHQCLCLHIWRTAHVKESWHVSSLDKSVISCMLALRNSAKCFQTQWKQFGPPKKTPNSCTFWDIYAKKRWFLVSIVSFFLVLHETLLDESEGRFIFTLDNFPDLFQLELQELTDWWMSWLQGGRYIELTRCLWDSVNVRLAWNSPLTFTSLADALSQ